MKLNYASLQVKNSLLKSSTGLGIKEFLILLPAFEKAWNSYNTRYTLEGLDRQRRCTTRKNNRFKSVEDMLVFILYDYRHNPTQEVMALHFGLTQPKVALWLKVLEPLLLKALTQLKLVPKRTSDGLDKIAEIGVTLLLDGTERPINRPKYDQQDYYSGKKIVIH